MRPDFPDKTHEVMTLNEFIENFDKPGNFILLEGKREVAGCDMEKLIALGRLLASITKEVIFRSGNADGSDQLFSDGVASVDKSRLQVIVPYSGHRKKINKDYATYSLDEISLLEEPEVVLQTKSHQIGERFLDSYLAGENNRFTRKVAYIARDTVKVIGTSEIPPVVFGIFYDDLKKPRSGGTGHTMNVCLMNDIPFADQTEWFKWLEE